MGNLSIIVQSARIGFDEKNRELATWLKDTILSERHARRCAMAHYIYDKPRRPTWFWLVIVGIAVIVSVITTIVAYGRQSATRIQELENIIREMKRKEIYYKEIEQKFFEHKAESVKIERYEEMLEAKDNEMTTRLEEKDAEINSLLGYIDELAVQCAAFENEIKKIATLSTVLPDNYQLPEPVSRGTYDYYKRQGKLEYVGEFLMTVYAPTVEECGKKDGITKSGAPVKPGVTIAVDPKYWKFGQKFYVEGYGVVEAADVGSAIKGKLRLDYCVLDPNISQNIGSKKVKVWVINE